MPEYIIDLGSFSVEARNEEEAYDKASKMIMDNPEDVEVYVYGVA